MIRWLAPPHEHWFHVQQGRLFVYLHALQAHSAGLQYGEIVDQRVSIKASLSLWPLLFPIKFSTRIARSSDIIPYHPPFTSPEAPATPTYHFVFGTTSHHARLHHPSPARRCRCRERANSRHRGWLRASRLQHAQRRYPELGCGERTCRRRRQRARSAATDGQRARPRLLQRHEQADQQWQGATGVLYVHRPSLHRRFGRGVSC